MKEKNERKLTGLEIALYIIAAVAFAYAVYAFVSNWITLKQYYAAQGQSRAKNWQQLVQTLVNGSGVYLLFAVVMYSISSAIAYFRDLILDHLPSAVQDKVSQADLPEATVAAKAEPADAAAPAEAEAPAEGSSEEAEQEKEEAGEK